MPVFAYVLIHVDVGLAHDSIVQHTHLYLPFKNNSICRIKCIISRDHYQALSWVL